MQEILFAYQVISIFLPSKKHPPITLQELEDFVFQYDIKQTLQSIKTPIQSAEIKEAYLCLVALMEQLESLNKKNKQIWFFNSYRIGDVSNLAKDIHFWYQKLLIRLLVYSI